MIFEGKDSLGSFKTEHGSCGYCSKPGLIVIYSKMTFPEGIKEDNRILIFDDEGERVPLGILCGCYAKFHRQIAHIQDRMKR